MKIEGATASLRYNGRYYADHSRRPNSDGVMYGGSHQRRVEFEVLLDRLIIDMLYFLIRSSAAK